MTAAELAAQRCPACRGDTPRLTGEALARFSAVLPRWTVIKDHHRERALSFPDFKRALAFVNRVGEVAEAEGHHPDLTLGWGKVGITLWTHAIDGLSEADFVLAAKIEQLV
jgi:4a-hydroxytetrahydrobiopterin dehydratase